MGDSESVIVCLDPVNPVVVGLRGLTNTLFFVIERPSNALPNRVNANDPQYEFTPARQEPSGTFSLFRLNRAGLAQGGDLGR